ncbi:hypothetical protein L209DRAFT_742118 [Thermothelomyces heterothallicus CBS 203.75]
MEDQIGQDMYKVCERIYGRHPTGRASRREGDRPDLWERGNTRGTASHVSQHLHRVSSFSLKDRNEPGQGRFIALWLVDPLRRIVSTTNVPPQQFDWWTKAVFGTEAKTLGNIPPEVFQLLLERGAGRCVTSSEELLL